MKKSYILMIVAMFCMFATGCKKEEMKTIGRFIVSEQGFVDPDSKMHFTWLDGASSHLSYDNNDALIINGYHFTLHKSGTQWYAEEQNHTDVTAANFYSIYADPNMSVSGSGPNYGFNYTFTGQIANTNGIILAGSTEDSLLTLKPACAIIRFPAGHRMEYVRVGFSANTIPSSGTLNVSSGTPSISATAYVPGVTDELSGGFLEMVNDGTDAYATYYVAVPIKNGSVGTQLFLTWKDYGSSDVYKFKTSGPVTLQQGKVYTIGKTRVQPFQDDGSTKGIFRVSSSAAVRFSAGNLQYLALEGKWRFAPTQYSAIGQNNSEIDFLNTEWIDLFGYGCTGATYDPNEISTTIPGYYETSNSISGTTSDWGYYLGTNIYFGNVQTTSSTWRTLTQDEWNYLLAFDGNPRRVDKWGLATVGSTHGLVLIPDAIRPDGGAASSWSSPCSFTPGAGSGYATNTYSVEQWGQMENAGAVFLPVTGTRTGLTVNDYLAEGHYWTATGMDASTAFNMIFANIEGDWYACAEENRARYNGCAVRLVRNM